MPRTLPALSLLLLAGPVAAQPTLTGPLAARPGRANPLALTGSNLGSPTGVWASAGVALLAPGPKSPTAVPITLTLPPFTQVGIVGVRVATAGGVSNLRLVAVDELPEVAEVAENRSREAAQPVPVPCVVVGRADPEAADYFRIPVTAGRPLTLEVVARRLGSPLDPLLIVHGPAGSYADDTPGLQTDCRLVIVPKATGELVAEVRDTTYKGGADFHYRLRVGNFPGATTAYPLAVRRGTAATVSFTGPDAADCPSVRVTGPADPAILAVNAVPRRVGGLPGWPVPVRVSDHPELEEVEPNDKPDAATAVPVPGGVSARFLAKNDVDQFRFPVAKGTRYAVEARTFEVGSPAEVYLRVVGPDGKELGASDPQKPTARVEFAAPADGTCVAVCEHLNYLAGPSEVYHLSVAAASPDFAVSLAADRATAPAGGLGLIPVANVNRVGGFDGPVTLTVAGDPDLSGSVTLAPGATGQVPVFARLGAAAGPRGVAVVVTGTAGGRELIRAATTTDAVKAALSGLPFPPAELTTTVVVGVGPPTAFRLIAKAETLTVAAGASAKLAVRVEGFDGEVTFSAASAPANVTVKGKGTEAEIVAAGNAAGGQLVIRGTAKVGGQDVAVLAAPVTLTVTGAEKPKPKAKKK